MTTEQIEIVKKSWRSLQGINTTLLGDVFYSRLFLDEPSLEKMFKASKEVQGKKLMDMLHFIVIRLDKLDDLKVEIKTMADRHLGYGVKPKHYNYVGKALLWTLKIGMGKDWNTNVAEAWTTCYGELSNAMTSK